MTNEEAVYSHEAFRNYFEGNSLWQKCDEAMMDELEGAWLSGIEWYKSQQEAGK